MLKFFSCRSNKFFPGSFGRKRIGSGTLWNFSWPAATRNSKIGFPRQFFLPYEPVKNFSHGKKKFSHWQKRKINEQSTIEKWKNLMLKIQFLKAGLSLCKTKQKKKYVGNKHIPIYFENDMFCTCRHFLFAQSIR